MLGQPSVFPTTPHSICYYFGTFNPIHHGHLLIAESVLVQFGFERILFIPAGQPPHRLGEDSMSPALDRLAMARLATGDHPRFSVSDIETRREGPSYTFDTLRLLRPDLLGAENASGEKTPLILGADALKGLGTWHRAEELISVCQFLQAPRPDYPLVERVCLGDRWLSISSKIIDMPQVEISATGVRERVRAGKSIRFLVPESVRRYILDNGLYRSGEPANL